MACYGTCNFYYRTMTKKILERALGAALAVGVACAALVSSGASAYAATGVTKGNLVVCAEGNYIGGADVEQINGGNGLQPSSPSLANRGACSDVYYGTSLNTTFTVKVYGFYNISGQQFYMGTVTFNPAQSGLVIDLLGTTTNWSLYSHN